jgi:hypothetical protein
VDISIDEKEGDGEHKSVWFVISFAFMSYVCNLLYGDITNLYTCDQPLNFDSPYKDSETKSHSDLLKNSSLDGAILVLHNEYNHKKLEGM